MHNAAETYLGAATVADDGTALKQEIEEMVYQMVLYTLDRMLMSGDTRLQSIIQVGVRNMEYEIKKMALRAVKEHYINPQHIY